MAQKRGVLARGVESEKVEETVAAYLDFHQSDDESKRKTAYTTMINMYYNLATDFYEYGWGQSFHFAPRGRSESFASSLARHEHYLALRLKAEKEWRVLDVGCGVGGPARAFARFVGCSVVGVNNNEYQLERARIHTSREGLTSLCSFVKADFMHLPFEDNEFDGLYQIEATAHAPDKTACYKELFRVLKPGACFASYEWCLTDKYDPNNEEHRAIKKGIEDGDGLPDIATTAEVEEALKVAGFLLLSSEDVALQQFSPDILWFDPLVPRYSASGNIQHTWLGKKAMGLLLRGLEAVGLAPKGTVHVQEFLQTAAWALVRGGELGIFTPSFFTLARKPLE